jgi:chromosome segregation ATPase
MTSINDETTPGRNQQGLRSRLMTRINLAYDGLEDKRNKFHTAKANDQQEIFNALSDGSPVGQKLVEKSIQYAELKQEIDDLRYKLEEADRKHELVEEERAALYDMVHSLQQELDGCAIDEKHKTTIENGNIIITSQGKFIENERIEHKKKCDKFQREKDGLVDREREVRHSLSLESMKSMIDQAEETNELLSRKCETLNKVIQELEGEKALQQEKIEALETQFQDFNTSRLERASRGPERGPYYEDTWKKISGDDDGFRGRVITTDTLWRPEASSPSARSGTYATQSKYVQKHQQEEDDTGSSTSFDSHGGRFCLSLVH